MGGSNMPGAQRTSRMMSVQSQISIQVAKGCLRVLWRTMRAARTVPKAPPRKAQRRRVDRSEEHTSELQSLMRISYAVFCLKKKTSKHQQSTRRQEQDNN